MIKWYTAHPKIVGNKAKGRISKRVFRENKARQIFLKTNISYSLTRTRSLSIPLENINVLFLYPLRFSDVFRGYRKRTYAYQGVFSEKFVFRKIWRTLFSWNTCFEISSFGLFSTKYQLKFWVAYQVLS